MDDLLKFSINLCNELGVEWAEARFVESNGSGISYENNVLSNNFIGSDKSLYVRFKIGNSMSSVFINSDFSNQFITKKIKIRYLSQ